MVINRRSLPNPINPPRRCSQVFRVVFAVGLFGLLVPGIPAASQGMVQVTESGRDPPYKIVLDTLLTLSDNGEGIAPIGMIVVDGGGRFLAGPT